LALFLVFPSSVSSSEPCPSSEIPPLSLPEHVKPPKVLFTWGWLIVLKSLLSSACHMLSVGSWQARYSKAACSWRTVKGPGGVLACGGASSLTGPFSWCRPALGHFNHNSHPNKEF
jgi:hypothetical protein